MTDTIHVTSADFYPTQASLDLIKENERLKAELAEVKMLLQEMYSPTQRYSDRVVSGYWRQRIERHVK